MGRSTPCALAPGGAHPSYAHGYYDRDNDFYVAWDAISRDRDTFLDGCERHVLETADVDEYHASLRSRHERHVTYTADEMMAVEAARRLRDGMVCFVGIGLPSLAANLARRDARARARARLRERHDRREADRLPLSIGDGELAETADAVVSVPEIFAYWLQGGRIDVGFLGAAQIDRYGEPEQHRDRRLRRAEGAAAGRRRRARDRDRGEARCS